MQHTGISKEIRINLKQLDKLVHHAQDVLAIFDRQGKEVFVSRSAERVLGYTPGEIIESTGWKFVHPDDVQKLKAALNKLNGEPGMVLRHKHRLRHKNGHWLHVELIGINLLDDPDIKGYVVSLRDTTAQEQQKKVQQKLVHRLRQSEKKYRELHYANRDGIVRIDMQGNIMEANPAFAWMLGYDHPSELPPNCLSFTPAQWHDLDVSIIREQVLTRGYSDEYEKEYIRRDGSVVQVSLKVYLITEKGRTEGMWGIVRDISLQKRDKSRLSLAVEQLEQLNRHKVEARETERKAIASAIHDEIGQAMTALNFELGWLNDNLGNKTACREKIGQLLSITNEAIRQAQRISGELRPNILDDLGLGPAIEWYCGEFERRTGIACSVSICPCYVNKTFELPLFRILQEALTNTARHSGATSVKVELQCTRSLLKMRIHDNGKGIAPEMTGHRESFGLMGMRERAGMCGGRFRISAKNGTLVEVEIPFFE